MMRKLGSATLAIVLVLLAGPARGESEPWLPEGPASKGTVGVYSAPISWRQFVQFIEWPANMTEPGVRYTPIFNGSCDGLVGDCTEDRILKASKDSNISVSSLMPICASASSTFCIENIDIRKVGEGDWTPLRGAEIGPKQASIASEKMDLPEGGGPSLWSSADGSRAFTFSSRTLWVFRDGKMVPNSFEAHIYPTDVKSGQGKFGDAGIVWAESSRFGVWKKADPSDEFQVQFRIPANFSRFITTRIENASYSASTHANGSIRVTLSGATVAVPFVRAIVDQDKLRRINPGFARALGGIRLDPSEAVSLDGELWNEVVRASGDRSTGTQQLWSFYILSRTWDPQTSSYAKVGGEYDACVSDRNPIIGLVASDAMAINARPPVLSSGTFEYQVSGLHFNSTGQLTSGFVTYLLNQNAVKCLYKFTKLPLGAKVSILSESGESKVTTTTTSAKGENLSLKVRDIHFSSPSLRVTFLQNKATTIKCFLKGKIKVVTGASPKCPRGYSLKK